jgi:hypothetical protein
MPTHARSDLADPISVELCTFDISPRDNRDIERARETAAAGKPYTIQLLCSPFGAMGSRVPSRLPGLLAKVW